MCVVWLIDRLYEVSRIAVSFKFYNRDARLQQPGIGKNSIAYLDINNTVNEDGKIEVGVYRKATHTSKYLDFHSQSSPLSKRAAKTLMDRAKCIQGQQLRKDRARSDVSSYQRL